MLPWIDDKKEGYNKEEYGINGHLYGRLERGTYLVVISSAENLDFSDSVSFKLRFIAADISVSAILRNLIIFFVNLIKIFS